MTSMVCTFLLERMSLRDYRLMGVQRGLILEREMRNPTLRRDRCV